MPLRGVNAKGLIIFETELDLAFPRIRDNSCPHNNEVAAHDITSSPMAYLRICTKLGTKVNH